MDEKRILTVGLSCLDIVMVCKSFPEEDSDQRCLSHRWQRGGNASNNCTVFSKFNVPCEYFGTLAKDNACEFVTKDFQVEGICFENCVYYEDCKSPTSFVLINSQNGSRTILHSNENLPELTIEDFNKLDLKNYKWIHFECRPNVHEMKKMTEIIHSWNRSHTSSPIPVSIELEKPKPGYAELLNCGDVIFISKDFARMCGHETMQSAVEEIGTKIKPGTILICPWGEDGACAKCTDGSIITSPAFPPDRIIDTLAAGDTFVSATIMALAEKKLVIEAVTFGCKVAGAKCGMRGMQGLKDMFYT